MSSAHLCLNPCPLLLGHDVQNQLSYMDTQKCNICTLLPDIPHLDYDRREQAITKVSQVPERYPGVAGLEHNQAQSADSATYVRQSGQGQSGPGAGRLRAG